MNEPDQLRRRTFLRLLATGLGGVTLGIPSLSGCRPRTTAGRDRLFDAFRMPSAEARPFFRWWWNGNRVTRNELLRELHLMHAVGAGGVEINPIAMHEVIEHPPGEAVVWLGDAWNTLVAGVAQEGRALGMVTDLIVGTGWPFGGEFLEDDETIQGVELEVIDVTGPTRFSHLLPGRDDVHRRLLQARLFPEVVRSLDEGVDVMDRVQADGTIAFDVPDGAHQVYLLTWRNRFRDVLFGAPGGAGPVLDHFNRQVVEKYLRRMSDRLKPFLGEPLGHSLRAMFCDSIELEGANWTGDLPEAFERRRGYDLLPILPLVLHRDLRAEGDLGDTVRRVRYDYSRTLAALFMERFIEPFHAWCHENGLQSRYQAYGYPWLYTDLLDGYLVPDIPEGDQWLFNPGWVHSAVLDDIRYAIWNKYAASGGHLRGRRIISTEAMTNTSGVFEASLAYIKQATDIDFITGVNHLVLHGFNYSPPEAGRPGWMRFGTYFSEHNSWWPYARRWFDYAARLSQVFQDADPVMQVALLGPTPDVWSDHGLDRNPWNLTPWYLHALWQALNHHGYGAEYVNGTVLRDADFEQGTIRYGPMQYRALVLADVASLLPETAEALVDYAEAGGRLLFIGARPARAPGLPDQAAQDERVQQAVSRLLTAYDDRVQRVAAPGQDTLIDEAGAWMQALRVAPAVRLHPIDPRLFFVQYREGERDLFFFANTDRGRSIHIEASFATAGKTAWRWDPETGERSVYQLGTDFPVTLDPGESLLLVFESGRTGETPAPRPAWLDEPVAELRGRWGLRLEGMDGSHRERDLAVLDDLNRIDGLAAFSGTVTYTMSFEAPDGGAMLLDLGDVRELSDVRLNGEALGVRWYGRHRFDLTGKLQPGANILEVRVTTLAASYYRSLQDDATAQYWAERSRRPEPGPSGLIGPVRLYQRVS